MPEVHDTTIGSQSWSPVQSIVPISTYRLLDMDVIVKRQHSQSSSDVQREKTSLARSVLPKIAEEYTIIDHVTRKIVLHQDSSMITRCFRTNSIITRDIMSTLDRSIRPGMSSRTIPQDFSSKNSVFQSLLLFDMRYEFRQLPDGAIQQQRNMKKFTIPCLTKEKKKSLTSVLAESSQTSVSSIYKKQDWSALNFK